MSIKEYKPSDLLKYEQRVGARLPGSSTVQAAAFVAEFETLAKTTLAGCQFADIAKTMLQVCALGLSPSPITGEVYVLPYRAKGGTIPQVQIGYRGYLAMAQRNGIQITAEAVYKGDTFDYELGTSPHIRHVPNLDVARTRQNMQCVYVIARFPDGSLQISIATRHEIGKRENSSKSKNSQFSPWQQWYVEMAKKTAIKMAAKTWNLASIATADAHVMQTAIGIDDSTAADLPEVEIELEPQTDGKDA